MPRRSAGLILFRRPQGRLEVLLVHPGGPYWRNRDEGAWTLPKGEVAPGEEPLAAACREFREETGLEPGEPGTPGTPGVPGVPRIELTPVRQKGGKWVHAWAFEGDCDPAGLRSNTYRMEWPYRSGRYITVPEVDRAEFFDLPTARRKINPAQIALLDELEQRLAGQCPLAG